MNRVVILRACLVGAALAAAAIFPIAFTNQLVLTMGFFTLLYIVAAVAWNLFSGYTGYISLGHAVFFGSGAYVTGIVARDLHLGGAAEFALLPLALAVGALIAVPFGLIALRVRRHTFVVITIAIFFIFQLMAFDLKTTGGTAGLYSPFLPWGPVVFGQRFYYIVLALAVGTVAISWLIRGSRFGLQLRAIRDDEDRAASLGVRAMPVKLTAFVISGAITGLAGAIWFFYISQILPGSGFDPIFDLTVALMAFFGGLGTVSGPLLGALIIEPVQYYLNFQINNGYLSQIVLGALFLLVILFLPRGLVPTVGEKASSWRARRESRALDAGAISAGQVVREQASGPGPIAKGTAR
ncbi:MAG TPA: branched-chain amino acid ABC transporter permease [Streptosporangiaceae bacterium]|nr:branched-chain amino acid ABC transporter permease [Streptosporangiaceae bacterium]